MHDQNKDAKIQSIKKNQNRSWELKNIMPEYKNTPESSIINLVKQRKIQTA